MARKDIAALAEPMTAEETSLMDADRDSEHSVPESAPEPEPNEPEPEQKQETSAVDKEPEQNEPEIDPATGKQRKVDYGALHAEREKRRAAEGREREARENLAKLNGRFDVLQQLAQRSQAPKEQADQTIEVPDINLDPVGHFAAKDAIRERELNELRGWRQQQERQSEVRNNVTRIQEIAQSHEAEFSKTVPDYAAATEFLKQTRDAELIAMGYSDASQRQQMMSSEAIQIAAQALNAQKNPAEVVYNIAKARGYAVKAPPAPAKQEPHPDTVKLQNVAKGQKSAASLGQVNGSAPAETSVETILKMSDSDFEKWATDDNWRKLMGG